MAAKERHKQKVKQRLHDRLEAISLQEESLHSLIRDYVHQARTRAEDLLATEDTAYFMQQYGSVEQLLDRVNNTCELLSTTAEDMIETSELDMTVKPDMSMLSTEKLSGHLEETPTIKHAALKTSTPEKGDHIKQSADRKIDLQGQAEHALRNTVQDSSTQDKNRNDLAVKDENIKRELQAMLDSTKVEPDKQKDQTRQKKSPHKKKSKNQTSSKTSKSATKSTTATEQVSKKAFEVSENESKQPKTLPEKTSKDLSEVKKQNPLPKQSTSDKSARSSSDSIPKHGNANIPSPVKKMLATYIGKDEKEEETKDDGIDAAGDVKTTCSSEQNKSTLKINTVKSVSGQSEASYTGKRTSIPVTELSQMLPPKTSSTASSTYVSDTSFTTCDSGSDLNEGVATKHSFPKVSQLEGSSMDHPSADIMCKDTEGTSREAILNDLGLEQSCLPLGKVTPVIVSDIYSPWCFCVQTNPAEVNLLMEQICTYMSRHGLHQEPLNNPKQGQMCLAKFSKDTTFYRAYILSCFEASKEVEVLYVDYGNRERVKILNLRKFPSQFSALPMQAICCSLAEIMPSNKYMVWREEDIMVFKHYVLNQQLNCIQACRCSTPGVPVIVRLISNYPVPAGPGAHMYMNQISIGGVLVDRGTAKYVNTVDQIGHLEKSGEGKEESLILNKNPSSQNLIEIHDKEHVTPISQCQTGEKMLVKNQESVANVRVSERQTGQQIPIKDPENCAGETDKTEKKAEKEKSKKCPVKLEISDGGVILVKGDKNNETLVKEGLKHQKSSENPSNTSETSNCDVGDKDLLKNSDSTMANNKGYDTTAKIRLDRGLELSSQVKTEAEQDKDVEINDESVERVTLKIDQLMDERLEDLVLEKQAVAESETMSSTCTTDLESERSTDTGFQSTEVTFDLKMNPQGEEVMLAHVQSPTLFYVHILQVGQTMDLLMKSLNKHFEKMNRRKLTRLSQTFVPAVTKLCCAQFLQDNNFYRALILKIRSDSAMGVGKVHVRYIDFGDEDWLPKRRLFPLPPQYSSVPPLAIKCKLAYIKPVTVETEDGDHQWSESVTKAFVEMMSFEKTLHMQVVEGHLTSGCKGELVGGNDEALGVYLVDTSGTEEVCANMDLISRGHAVLDLPKTGNLNELHTNEEMGDWNPMEADYLSKRNTYQMDIEDAEMATVGYKSGTRKGVCRYFSKGAHCWSGENCPYRHVQSDSAVPLEREEVYCTDNQSEALPEVNSWVAAEVITILTPGHFYILLPMGNKSLDGTSEASTQDENANPACTETLDDLLIALNTEYSKKSPHDRTLQLKAPGEIVVARFSQDKQWYRARVIQVTEEKVKVFFLDFGNTEWLPDEEIVEISPEFLHLPFQAFECFLCNVEPAGDENWSSGAKNAFRELVDGKTLVAHIRSRSWNGCLSVDLYDTSEDVDVNISEKLIEQSHAIRSSFLTDSSCNGSVSGQSQKSNSDRSEVIFLPG